jgi:hypothetical protein
LGGGLALVGLTGVGLGIGWLTVDGRTTCNALPGGVCHHLYDTTAQGWVAVGAGAAVTVVGAALLLWPTSRSSGVTVGPKSMAFTTSF